MLQMPNFGITNRVFIDCEVHGVNFVTHFLQSVKILLIIIEILFDL